MFKLILSIMLLGMTSYRAYAQGFNTQEGWVVTNAGDTLYGHIKDLKDKREKILFKSHTSTTFKAYSPKELISFRYTGEYYYKTKKLPEKDQTSRLMFVQCFIEGPLSLYRDPDYFYVEKPEGTLYKLEQVTKKRENGKMYVEKRYISTLLHLTRECPDLQEIIKGTRLHTSGLINVVTAYHQCLDPSQEVKLTTKPSKVKLRVGVKLGTHISNISHFQEGKSVRDYDFVKRVGYIGGALFDLSYKDKFSLRPEVLIAQKGASFQGVPEGLGEREVYSSLTSLHLPLSIYYTLPTQQLRPFVLAGGAMSYTIADKSYLISPIGKREIDTGKQYFGYRAGGGLSYILKDKHRFNVEYVYERTKTSGTYWRVKTQYVSHSITIGIEL